MGLVEIAENGDRLATLKELRTVLAQTITSTSSARETSALALQLRLVLAEIDEIEKGQQPDDGELAQFLREKNKPSVRPDRRSKTFR